MADLRAVPTLDALAAQPELAAKLPADERRRIVSRLAALILAVEATELPAGNGQAAPRADRLLDASQAAARLSVPVTWIRDMARQGKLPSVKLGHYVRFRPDDLERFICEHR